MLFVLKVVFLSVWPSKTTRASPAAHMLHAMSF
jgi:hypothetical protein